MKNTYSIIYEFTEGRGKHKDNEAVVTFRDLTIDELKQNLTNRKGDLNMNTVIRIVQEPTVPLEDVRSFVIEQISNMSQGSLVSLVLAYPTLASCFRVDLSSDRGVITRIMPYDPADNSAVYDHRTGWE
jgi:tryptophanase